MWQNKLLQQCRHTCKETLQYQYDFKYLQDHDEHRDDSERKCKKNRRKKKTPMLALNVMVRFNRVECLSHPVCVTFLKMKWRAYGFFLHMLNIGIYVVFLAVLTSYICTLDYGNLTWTPYNESKNITEPQKMIKIFTWLPFHSFAKVFMAAFCALSIVKEIVQIAQQKFNYFTDLTNLLEWILYITTAMFVITPSPYQATKEQWQCGAVAVFLAWFNLLLYLQRFDMFGIYVVMFLEILKTLLQVIVVFSILIIAFGLSFYILLAGEQRQAHRTPLLSLMRTFVMMLGELEYIPNFVEPLEDEDPDSMPFGVLTYLFLIVFILLMPILLMNLLIGLAVGDIESVQQNARLKRLAMQVALHTDLEGKLPKRILQYVDRTDYKVYPPCSGNVIARIVRHYMNNDDEDAYRSKDSLVDSVGLVPSMDPNTYLLDQITKQKRRIRDLSNSMEKQNDLLRLIVQKMEIKAESEECESREKEETLITSFQGCRSRSNVDVKKSSNA